MLMPKNDKEQTIAVQYVSRSLTKLEQMYSTIEKEAAVFFTLKKFRHHLFGDPAIFYRYHEALRSAVKKFDIHFRLARWLGEMAEYGFDICYVDCTQITLAVFLSPTVRELALEGDEKDKQVIEHSFCKHNKWRLERAKIISTVDGNSN